MRIIQMTDVRNQVRIWGIAHRPCSRLHDQIRIQLRSAHSFYPTVIWAACDHILTANVSWITTNGQRLQCCPRCKQENVIISTPTARQPHDFNWILSQGYIWVYIVLPHSGHEQRRIVKLRVAFFWLAQPQVVTAGLNSPIIWYATLQRMMI